MNKNFISRLEKKKEKEFKVQPVFYNDKKKFLLNNFLKKQNFLNTKEVLSITQISFLKEEPIGYVLIKNDKDIVGFLGTIFSKRSLKNPSIEHCYLHSWIVFEQYRMHAFKLILPILRKNIFISTYSPIKSLEGLYRKLEFEESYFYSKLVLSLPFFNFKKKEVTLNLNTNIFTEYLSSIDKKIFEDHNFTNVGKIFIYFNNNKNNNIFIIVKKKIKFKFIPILEILYISDQTKFQLHEKEINFELMKKFKTLFFKVNFLTDNKIFCENYLFKKITRKNVYYFNKPKDFKFDVLYSEFLG